MYVLELYSERETFFIRRYFSKDRENVFVFKGDKEECLSLQRKARRRGYKTNVFADKFNRTNNYRQIFFDSRPGQTMFRCAYCGRIYSKNHITVDHVVPIYAAKRYFQARTLLKIQKCDGVNDLKNLVPACRRCNYKKGHRFSFIYSLRAIYGENDWYWKMVWTLRIIIGILLLIVLFRLIRDNKIISIMTQSMFSNN